MMSREEYKKKSEELTGLARSIDLWKQASKTKKQDKEVRELFTLLEAETYALECKFLETKLGIFTKILAKLKE